VKENPPADKRAEKLDVVDEKPDVKLERLVVKFDKPDVKLEA